MFSQRTNERLKLFENQLVEVSNTGVEIEEKIEWICKSKNQL